MRRVKNSRKWRKVLAERLISKVPAMKCLAETNQGIVIGFYPQNFAIRIRSLRGTNNKLVELEYRGVKFTESTSGFPSPKLVTQLNLIAP